MGGVLGLAFFCETDPHVSPHAIEQLGWGSNLVDATLDAMAGSVIGLVGSMVIVGIGLWLVMRRTI